LQAPKISNTLLLLLVGQLHYDSPITPFPKRTDFYSVLSKTTALKGRSASAHGALFNSTTWPQGSMVCTAQYQYSFRWQ